MIKGKIHKEGRYIKPPDALTTKKQRYIKQKSEEIQGKEKICNHSKTLTFLWEYLSSTEKNKNKSILNDVNNLNIFIFNYVY